MSSEGLSRSEIDGKLRQLDDMLDKLRRDYEQFFVGTRERPPRNERKKAERLVRELEQAQVSNTSQQFRLRSLIQRFSSYRQKWNRIQRQIEEGTYQPHQKRAEKRIEDEEGAEGGSDGGDSATDDSDADHVVEIDEEIGEVDLGALEEELKELDDIGASEDEGSEDARLSQEDDGRRPRSSSAEAPRASEPGRGDRKEKPAEQARDRGESGSKRDKIRKMQEKLGISSGGSSHSDGGSRADSSFDRRKTGSGTDDTESGPKSRDDGPNRSSLERLRENLGDDGPPKGREGRQSRGDGDEHVSKNRRRSDQREREPSAAGRSPRRERNRQSSEEDDEGSTSDDDEGTRVEILYRRLMSAKRDVEGSTDPLTLENFRRSLTRQRRRVTENYEVDRVRFEVVIKDESVYLQPRLPD